MEEQLTCGICNEDVRPVDAQECCGEIFHAGECYRTHRDAMAAADTARVAESNWRDDGGGYFGADEE